MQKSIFVAAICGLAMSLHTASLHAAFLSVTRIGEGTVQPGVGVHNYSASQQVTLRATPAEGWVVDHWEGDLSGTGSTKTTSMSGNKRVTVAFRPLVPTPGDTAVDASPRRRRSAELNSVNSAVARIFNPQP